MTATLQKYIAETLYFDLDCTQLLDENETITSITAITADQAGLTIGTYVINTETITYSDGLTALPGKVITVQISDGTIPSGAIYYDYTIRATFLTSVSGTIRQAVVKLRVSLQPVSC